MRIAVDYDGTFTADPVLWMAFMADAQRQGHEVFIVTIRNDLHDEDEWLASLKIRFPVYFTRGVAKRWWCLHHGPGAVDVWIDDTPESILENSPMTPEEILEWRARKAARKPHAEAQG